MAKIKMMVMCPAMVEVEAPNFEKAKQMMTEEWINQRRIKSTDPLEFREVVEAKVTEVEEQKS